MPTCAIYARVSDSSQAKGDSIEHQISYCQEVARRRSVDDHDVWRTPTDLVYVDEGQSGTSLIKRTAMQQMIRDARERRYDVVVFKGISRFARDTIDALVMLRTLLACGVRVISVEENYDSERDRAEFVFTIHSALAQAESEKTAIRVRMGATQKARQGKWNGQPPDGYVLNRETQRLEVDETFAPLIREIFTLYLSGHGVRKIADTLNQRGYRTKRGNRWSQRSISRLLRNPAYVGDVVYGRRTQRRVMPELADPVRKPKQTVWVNDETLVTRCKDAHCGIVDRRTFEIAGRRLNQQVTRRGQLGRGHLLVKGLLKCHCGSSMTIKYNGHQTAYYRCIGQAEKGRSFCNQRYLRADELESVVLNRVRMDMIEALGLTDVEVTVPAGETSQRLQTVRQQVERLMHRSSLLFNQFASGAILEEQFAHLNAPFRQQLTELRNHETDLRRSETEQRTCCMPDGRGTVPSTSLVGAICELLGTASTDLQVTRLLLEVLVERVSVDEHGLVITYRLAEANASATPAVQV